MAFQLNVKKGVARRTVALSCCCIVCTGPNRAPRTVLDGIITSLHRSGVRTDAANYRPVTLSNTAYHISTKMLMKCLLRFNSAEQSAFLHGRHFGVGVMLLQLLPHAMALQRHRGDVLAVMDILKGSRYCEPIRFASGTAGVRLRARFVKWVPLPLTKVAQTRSLTLTRGHLTPCLGTCLTGCSLGLECGKGAHCPNHVLVYYRVAAAIPQGTRQDRAGGSWPEDAYQAVSG